MPRPTFDITEYELRGITPDVFTAKQQELLNQTLSRVNGQMDWTAQLLGYSGTNYWGRPNPKSDGSYNWVGLPRTMNEKRQMQAGTFGVYNKNLEYDAWPAPFNRSSILASGDAAINIFEKGGKTILAPLGQGQSVDFMEDPVLFVGASYVFNAEVDFTVEGQESNIVFYTFFAEGITWTRMEILQPVRSVSINIKQSLATKAVVEVLSWQDISDWKAPQTQNQFLGVWGNKGASLSFDVLFDALDVHGFNESTALDLEDVESCLTPEGLLEKVGLEPTTWTAYSWHKFGFKIGDCPVYYPTNPIATVESYDNGTFADFATDPPIRTLADGTLADPAPGNEVTDEGEYERPADPSIVVVPDVLNYAVCDSDCNFKMTLTQKQAPAEVCAVPPCPVTPEYVPGIGELCFTYEALSESGKTDFPCVEWQFDATLDNGTTEDRISFPYYPGPWATANDGLYDDESPCYEHIRQGGNACDEGRWCGYDDGEYDELVEPDCDVTDLYQGCDEADGGTVAINPYAVDYDDCACPVECCELDGGDYEYGSEPYSGPEEADGGQINEACVLYDNSEYDDPYVQACLLDNGIIDGTPPTDTVNEAEYNRVYVNCVECFDQGDPPDPEACPLDPISVNLQEVFSDATWIMRPSIRNALTPLRLWKDSVLEVVDRVPPSGSYHNALIADRNTGPQPEGAYRYFARLPLEYVRNGPSWSQAEAVCNNQGYFSAPPNLMQTEVAPQVSRPVLYQERYAEQLPDSTIFYDEGYIYSAITSDTLDVDTGFEDSEITFEAPSNVPYALAVITEYDPYEVRRPNADGSWKGSYYTVGLNNKRSGYAGQDVITGALFPMPESEYPTFDENALNRPNVEFPDDPDEAAMKDYVVSYAYFAADFSASDDPVFDPDKLQCWRNETQKTLVEVDGSVSCDDGTIPTYTSYLLHPSV